MIPGPSITVTVLDAPVAAPLTTNKPNDTICENESITFEAPAGGVTYEFEIDGVSQGAPAAARTFTTTAIDQDRTVSVIVTNAGGCTATSSVNVTVANGTTPGSIEVDADGDANATGDGNAATICPTGTQPLIGGNGVVGGAVATSSDDVIYEWDYSTNGGATFSAPIPGQTGPNLAAGTVNITQTTIVRRTAYATVAGTGVRCSGVSDQVTITVDNLNLTISAAETDGVANDDTICSGGTISFTAAGAAGGTIQWLVDGIAPAGALTDPGNVALYPETGLVTGQVVSYRVTTAAGCVIPGPSITVTVLDAPVAAPLTTNKPNDTICENESITFEAPAGGVTYEFEIDGVSQGAPAAARTFTTTAIDQDRTVSVIVTNAGGCTATSSVNVTVANGTTPGSIEVDADGDANATGDGNAATICPTGTQPLIGGNGVVGGAVATSSDDVIYEWDYSTNGGATFSAPIPGQSSGSKFSSRNSKYNSDDNSKTYGLCYGSWNRGSL